MVIRIKGKSLLITFLFSISFIFLISITTFGKQIQIKGVITEKGFPNRKFNGDLVTILVGGHEISKTVEDSEFSHLLPANFFNEEVIIRVDAGGLLQEKTVVFTPSKTNLPVTNRIEKKIVLVRPGVKAELHFKEFFVQLSKNDFDASYISLQNAIQINPKVKYYFALINYVKKALQNNSFNSIPYSLVYAPEVFSVDERFIKFSKNFRWKFFYNLGLVFLLKDSSINENIGSLDSGYNIATSFFETANKIDPASATSAQALYRIHQKNEKHVEAIHVIHEYFSNNSNIQNSKTISTFVNDWITSLEIATNFRNQISVIRYAENVKTNPRLKRMWVQLHEVIEKYKEILNSNSNIKTRLDIWVGMRERILSA